MLDRLVDALDSRWGQIIRFSFCCGFAIVLLVSVAFSRASQVDPVAIEHRFTSLETEMADLVGYMKEMKYSHYLELIGMSGRDR